MVDDPAHECDAAELGLPAAQGLLPSITTADSSEAASEIMALTVST